MLTARSCFRHSSIPSRSDRAAGPHESRSPLRAVHSHERAPNSRTRPSTGSRLSAAASPRRCMKATTCSRSGSPAPVRIRPGSCNPRQWPRSRRPSPLTGRTCRPTPSASDCCPMPSSRVSSMPARRTAATSPDRGWWTRPSTSSRLRPTMPRAPSASGAAGCWATAPAPAKAARSPASFWTTG